MMPSRVSPNIAQRQALMSGACCKIAVEAMTDSLLVFVTHTLLHGALGILDQLGCDGTT